MTGRVVVAGGGLAAARTCESLRRRGYDGEIVVLAAETVPPYDRPPLSKAALTGGKATTLRTDYAALRVELRLASPATGLDTVNRTVRTTTGPVDYEHLVIATGAGPVTLPGTGEQLTLRTAADAAVLRERLEPGTRVVLIGAGWINAEIATAATALGCTVTCLEAGRTPLAAALGEEVGERMLPWWRDVDLHCGVGVAAVRPGTVELRGGAEIPADVVVTGTGVRASTGWLSDSGLELDRGVLVDEHLRACSPGVYAVGDVAARWSPRWGRRVRIEHWDEARTAPDTVAAVIGGDRPVHDPVPYFWSDQFGHKLQYVGHHDAEDEPVVREGGDGAWGAAWLRPDGTLTAHLSIGRPSLMVAARKAVADGTRPDPATLGDLDTAL